MRFIELTLTAGKKKIPINTQHIIYVAAGNDGVGSGVGVGDADSYEYKVDESYQEVCSLVKEATAVECCLNKPVEFTYAPMPLATYIPIGAMLDEEIKSALNAPPVAKYHPPESSNPFETSTSKGM